MATKDKVNILLVDDQPAKLLSYEVILQDLGENLIKASSGTEALEQLLRNDVAVVLVDVCMPDLDGFELAAMIREHPRCEKTAIIFISAIHLADVDRLRGYEMGAVDYVLVPVVPQVLRAKVKIFAELYRKTRQLEQLNRELENRVAERTAELESYARRLLESERRRSLALAAGKMGSWDWDLETGDCMWDEGQCRIFGVDPKNFKITAERLKSMLHADDWERLKRAWAQVSPVTREMETEFRVRRPNGEMRWCLGTAAATLDAEDRISRVSGVTMDITERKQAEERQAFLAREVDHRARNVLAVVQSILRLTKASSIEAYVAAVEGRISALSRAHMLLSEYRWDGAALARLAGEELEPYRSGDGARIAVAGPEILLSPRSAQSIALVLHELATNAAKHGSLRSPAGEVAVRWECVEDNLVLDWRETSETKVVAPFSGGYGMRVIKASLEQLGGKVSFDWRPEGLHCILSVPLQDRSKAPVARPEVAAQGSYAVQKANGDNRVLLVEDEPLVAMMMAEALSELGFTVIGPFGTAAEAGSAVADNSVDAAILDINLGGKLVYPVADLLRSRGVPFAFVTGYGAETVDPRYAEAPVLQKPVDRNALRNLLVMGTNGNTGTA